MIQIISNIQIYRPIRRVFDFISTPENDFQWQYGTLTSTPKSGSTGGLGAHFESTSHLLGQRVQSTYEVTHYEPHTRYGYRSISGPLASSTLYTFQMEREHTQVRMSVEAQVAKSSGLNESIVEKKLKRQLKEDLAMLKQILEAA